MAAQESHRPQKDLPVGMLASLAICTILYIAMAAVMTGLVPYTALGTAEPVVTAVAAHPELDWLRITVEIGALIGYVKSARPRPGSSSRSRVAIHPARSARARACVAPKRSMKRSKRLR